MANNAIGDFIKNVLEDAKKKGEEIGKQTNIQANTQINPKTLDIDATKAVTNTVSNTIPSNINPVQEPIPLPIPPDDFIEKEEPEEYVKTSWWDKIKGFAKKTLKKATPEKKNDEVAIDGNGKKVTVRVKSKKGKQKHDNDRAPSDHDLNDPDDSRKFWNKTTSM